MNICDLREDLLHYIWRVRAFDQTGLCCSDGRKLRILKWGQFNRDGGPDFVNALLWIEGTNWAGHIEMHMRSSDWLAHGHDRDTAYDNVILHVVCEHDREIHRPDGTLLPVLQLRDRIDTGRVDRYKDLMGRLDRLPCKSFLSRMEEHLLEGWKARMAVERLEQKCSRITKELKAVNGDWEQLFFQYMARYLGQRVNGEAFWTTARRTPFLKLLKYRGQENTVEAILFGRAGMLDGNFDDSHPRELQQRYRYLARLHGWAAGAPVEWKLLRMRPGNFPTLRIAQLAAMIEKRGALFSRFMRAGSLQKADHLLKATPHPYWRDHHLFDRKSRGKRSGKPGAQARKVVIINAVIPFWFVYGNLHGGEVCRERAIEALEALRPEKNRVLNIWKEAGILPRNAFDSQALLHLYNSYCREKRCMECRIAHAVLSDQ